MHDFDLSLAVSGNSATVTLFGGKTVRFTKSGNAWQLASTEQLPYQFASAGSGFQFMSPVSNLVYSFGPTGALSAIADRNGNTLTVTQAPGGVGPATVSDGLGRTITFTYTSGALTKVQDQSGRSVSFQSTNGNLSGFTNANGKLTTYSYTSTGGLNGLITTETMPANSPGSCWR